MAGTAAWSQLHGEPDDAYRAFSLYVRSAPPRLPATRFAGSCSVLPWVIVEWSRAWRWDARLAAFDAWYDAEYGPKLKAIATESAESIRAKNREILVMTRELAADQLAKHLAQARGASYPRIKPNELVKLSQIAIQLNRELDADAKNEEAIAGLSEGWGDDLDDDELATMAALMDKASKRRKADIR